ncbi:serine hydrolase [Actinoplanes sp. N902-109]|uniref:serine hydrolase domain-containing protein n=1 Tax=Actinoplanes sp. (strain N902-109) TaxID=649831 RepID=UPI0003293DDC|nr:serine hydrolase domain-containing protein [Actinoplanes sp. N902-109]AGL13683.1 carboxylesterase [Actinoplanes sp. N902-109]
MRVAPGYEAVREAFAAHPSGGSALCVLRDGEVVVDLHEGWRDAAHTRPWDAETLVNVYSVGKPVIALAVLLLVDRGLVGLDDPVARHWPGFTTDASVRSVLTHTAGLVTFPVPRDASAWADWDLLCGDLAAATPEWPPGTVAAEHALTYGHLLGEVVRRVTGRAPAEFVATEIAQPWRLDFGFALGPADLGRCAELEFDGPQRPAQLVGEPGSVHARAVSNPPGTRDLSVLNSDLWRTAAVPAVNLHATAKAVARCYAGLLAGGELDGRRLLSSALVGELTAAQFRGFDHFIGRETTWGLGVQLEPDGTWGMGGLGGSAGWADPARGHAIGYVTRRLGDFARVDAIDAAISSVRSLI